MLKKLGFEKTAFKMPDIPKVVEGIRKSVSHYGAKARAMSQDISGTVESIAKDWGAMTPSMRAKAMEAAAKATKTTKKPGFKRGLAIGGGVGAVGTAGVYSLFGNRKRKSPYYP